MSSNTWTFTDPNKARFTPTGLGVQTHFGGHSRQEFGSPFSTDQDYNIHHPTNNKWNPQSTALLARFCDEEERSKFDWQRVADKMSHHTGRTDFTALDCMRKRKQINSNKSRQRLRAASKAVSAPQGPTLHSTIQQRAIEQGTQAVGAQQWAREVLGSPIAAKNSELRDKAMYLGASAGVQHDAMKGNLEALEKTCDKNAEGFETLCDKNEEGYETLCDKNSEALEKACQSNLEVADRTNADMAVLFGQAPPDYSSASRQKEDIDPIPTDPHTPLGKENHGPSMKRSRTSDDRSAKKPRATGGFGSPPPAPMYGQPSFGGPTAASSFSQPPFGGPTAAGAPPSFSSGAGAPPPVNQNSYAGGAPYAWSQTSQPWTQSPARPTTSASYGWSQPPTSAQAAPSANNNSDDMNAQSVWQMKNEDGAQFEVGTNPSNKKRRH